MTIHHLPARPVDRHSCAELPAVIKDAGDRNPVGRVHAEAPAVANVGHISDYGGHHCIPKYRAADGRYTRCWCGDDTRGEVELPADCEPGAA